METTGHKLKIEGRLPLCVCEEPAEYKAGD